MMKKADPIIVWVASILLLLGTLQGALAVAADFTDLNATCYSGSSSTAGVGDNRPQFTLVDACNNNNEIDYLDTVVLSLGAIQPDEVMMGADWVYVSSSLRPDLDVAAEITMVNTDYAVQPTVLNDGVVCGSCGIVSFDDRSGTLIFNVTGFSNYSLTNRQDFTVHSDEAPELHGKVYQVVDLGSSYRSEEFACNVMIFANDADNELVLVQTNPEREVQGRLFGDTDQQQPESLGYFPTQSGVANVYFRNDMMVGYTDFKYVAKCQSNSTQLIYEETITPVQAPLGRGFASWAVWFTTDNDGENSFFLVFYIIAGVIALWVVVLFIRKTFGGG
jgi:hypothetical protein